MLCILPSLGVGNEGWFDPWMLLNAFKKKVKSMGVKFLEADVIGVDVEDNAVKKVKVRKWVLSIISNHLITILTCFYIAMNPNHQLECNRKSVKEIAMLQILYKTRLC